MRKISKIIVALFISIVSCGSCNTVAQTVTPQIDNPVVVVEAFYCFTYDGGAIQVNVPVKNLLLSVPLLTPTKNCKVHRSSMEDIWLENQEEVVNTIKNNNPADLFAKNQ